jgi:hypothetical protein
MFKPKFKYMEIGKLLDMEVVKREGQARASYYVMR